MIAYQNAPPETTFTPTIVAVVCLVNQHACAGSPCSASEIASDIITFILENVRSSSLMMAEKTATVSVLMPVYNRAELVADAIRSIESQTFEDWEFIILDDGSTDRTLETCRSFEARDKRIHVFANEKNLGVGETRNRLITYATGKYIAHQDSDDVSVPERLKLQVELLDGKPEIGLVSGVTAHFDDNGQLISYVPEPLYKGQQYPQEKKEMVRYLYLGGLIANPTCMFRRDLIEKIPFPYGSYRVYEDRLFSIHMAHLALIWGIPEVLVKMRRGSTHVHLYNYTGPILGQVCDVYRGLYSYYKDNKNSPIDFSLYRKTMAISLVRKGRHVGSFKGFFDIVKALRYDPLNAYGWRSMIEFSGRAFRKILRFRH